MYRILKCVVCSLFAFALIALPQMTVVAADAKTAPESSSVLVSQDGETDVSPADRAPTVVAESVTIEPIIVQQPVKAGAAIQLCCPKPCIRYRHHRRRLKTCCTCDPPIETVLLVKNPNSCECCYVDIPVCIPACCTDAPCIDERCGILGRGIVTYKYCCGFEIKILFRARGDVVVHCFGG